MSVFTFFVAILLDYFSSTALVAASFNLPDAGRGPAKLLLDGNRRQGSTFFAAGRTVCDDARVDVLLWMLLVSLLTQAT